MLALEGNYKPENYFFMTVEMHDERAKCARAGYKFESLLKISFSFPFTVPVEIQLVGRPPTVQHHQ